MDLRFKKWAEVIIDWCWRLKRGEAVLIYANPTSEDLVLALEEKILLSGGHPNLKISLSGYDYIFYRYASEDQLKYFPPGLMELVKSVQAFIGVYDSVNTKELSKIDPRRQKIRTMTLSEYHQHIHDKLRWCATLFPTQAYAQEAGMSLEEFREFVFEAIFLNSKNPLLEYRKALKVKRVLASKLAGAKEIKIVGPGTDLSFQVAGREFKITDDRYNLPAGEIFLAPLEKTVEGRIVFGVHPKISGGQEMKGIELVFASGKVVSASAQAGEAYLKSLLTVDEGAQYLGELGIGLNFRIKQLVNNMLFDEKIGGTIHLALGHSFPSLTGGTNISAIHEDFLFDLREEGEVFIDGGKLIVQEDKVDLE